MCQGRRDGGRLFKVSCNAIYVHGYGFSRSSTSGNKTEKKIRNKIMESCQDLDSLIIVCTIICVLLILCLCVLKKTRNVPLRLSGPYADGDTHGLISKPTVILNGTEKMDSVQWWISRKQPIEHSEQPFLSGWFHDNNYRLWSPSFLFPIKLISHACDGWPKKRRQISLQLN